MKITEINLKEEGAKYSYENSLENFVVKNKRLIGEESGVKLTDIFSLDSILNAEFKKVSEFKTPYERVGKEEQYYFITAYKEVRSALETDHELDNKMIKSENYFNNKNYAEYINFKENLLRKLDRFAWENNKEVIDWDNERKRKYFIYYNHRHKIFEVCSNTYIQEMNIYFSDKEIAEKAIEEFKDDLIKLYTWDFNF